MIRGDDKLGPVVCSIIKYAKPNELKDDLNRQWIRVTQFLKAVHCFLSWHRRLP